jgi:hypothetical protein
MAPMHRRRTGTRLALTTLVAVVCLAGCQGAPRVTADTPEAELRSQIDQIFHPGMTLAQVQAGLDELKVPNMRRRAYVGPPPQLLARLFETGGFQLQGDQQVVHFTDLWFVFGPDKLLQRVETVPHEQMFVQGDPVNPPFHTPELLPSEPLIRPSAESTTP